jgi:hypothetical protein
MVLSEEMEAYLYEHKCNFYIIGGNEICSGGGGWNNIHLVVHMFSPTSARALISIQLLHNNQVLHFSNSNVPATSMILNCYYSELQQPAATSQPLCVKL